MFTSDQSDHASPNLGGLGIMGYLVSFVMTGFFLGSVVFITYVVVYQLVALMVYPVRFFIRLYLIEQELTAARAAAGDLALPVAAPTAHQRLVWATSTAS
jgi:hypothetical protein